MHCTFSSGTIVLRRQVTILQCCSDTSLQVVYGTCFMTV